MKARKSQSKNSYKLTVLWISVLSVMAVAGFQFLDNRLSQIRGGDAVNYLILAKSLATGHWFSDINIPGAPPHTQYPPLLPVILSPIFFFLGFNLLWMKAVIVVSGIASVYMIKRLFEDDDQLTAVLIAAMVGTNFFFYIFMKEIMTELPYLFLSVTAIILFRKYAGSRELRPFWLILPLAVSAAYFMRMIGITLYAAFVLALLLRVATERDRLLELKKLLTFSFAGILPFLIWTIRGQVYSEGVSTYSSIFTQADYYSSERGAIETGTLIARFFKNALLYTEAIPKALITSSAFKEALPVLALKVLVFLLLAFVVIGFLRQLFLKREVKDLYVALYAALLTVWPVYGSGDARRYVVPLLPFLYLYLMDGAGVTINFAGKALGRREISKGAIIAVITLIFLSMNIVQIKKVLLPHEAFKRVKAVVAGLNGFTERVDSFSPEAAGVDAFKKSAPCYSRYLSYAFDLKTAIKPHEVVMARKPEIVSLITGGFAVRFPFTGNSDAMLEFIEKNKVGYIIIDQCYPEAQKYLVPAILSRPESFNVVLDDSKGTIVLKYLGSSL